MAAGGGFGKHCILCGMPRRRFLVRQQTAQTVQAEEGHEASFVKEFPEPDQIVAPRVRVDGLSSQAGVKILGDLGRRVAPLLQS